MRIARILGALSLAAAAALPVAASASMSVAGGAFFRDVPADSGMAAIVSSGAAVPVVPLQLQGSLFVPVTGKGGYAATAEIRGLTGGGFGGAYIGAGVGLGTLSTDNSVGSVFTVFAGKSIAPFTSVELRLYKEPKDGGATAGFVGVRFSF
ncbi:MAG TPA: hypothetical protein VKT72_14830 [Candidatus Baltobacteraceae bacterium]|nr:hypothetical protein [Candidatus Baltobacteraceae bacterium]